MTRGLVFVVGLWLMGASDAHAQVSELPKVFVSVNVGSQSHTHSIDASNTFSIYAETATVTSRQGVDGGLLVDFGVAYRVMNNLAVGISGSRTGDTADATIVATIPHPVFFDRPVTTTTTLEGLDRREVGIHLQAMWFIPLDFLPAGARLAFTAGPSFFTVRQDLVRQPTAADVPRGTQSFVPVVEAESKSSVGVNAGFDIAFPIVPRIGVGAFVRYAGSSFDFDSAPGEKAGGFQAGGGLRLAF